MILLRNTSNTMTVSTDILDVTTILDDPFYDISDTSRPKLADQKLADEILAHKALADNTLEKQQLNLRYGRLCPYNY